MITARRYKIDNPEQFWRDHAPKGYENAFTQLKQKYSIKQTFGEAVTEAIEAQTQLDKAIRMVLRMRKIAQLRLIVRARYVESMKQAVDEIQRMRFGAARQGCSDCGHWRFGNFATNDTI